MTLARCTVPIEFSELVAYWFGELPSEAEHRLEEHLFGCTHCTDRLDELVGIGAGIRFAFEGGTVQAVISEPFLAIMKMEGLQVREYPVSPGGTANCTIDAADNAVVGRLQAKLVTVNRLDLVGLNEQGEVRFRLPDIPFNPVAGEVLFCPSAAALKKMPAHTDRVRLLAIDNSGEKLVGEYTFVHTPG